jgi:hypothetical protein
MKKKKYRGASMNKKPMIMRKFKNQFLYSTTLTMSTKKREENFHGNVTQAARE